MTVNKKLIGAVFALLLLFGASASFADQTTDNAYIAYLNKARATDMYQKLSNTIYALSWSHEFMIRDQHLYSSVPGLMQKDADRTLNALSNLILVMSNAGQLISKPTFCQLLKFDMQSDATVTPTSVNVGKLMTEKQYWTTKHDLLTAVWNDQTNFKGGSADEAMAKKYSRSDCPDIPLPEAAK